MQGCQLGGCKEGGGFKAFKVRYIQQRTLYFPNFYVCVLTEIHVDLALTSLTILTHMLLKKLYI